MQLARKNLITSMLGRRLFTLLLLGFLWAAIAKWDVDSLVVGIPSIVIALMVFERLRGQSKSGIRFWLLPEFSAWFFWQSLRSGIDVSWRTLQPRMPLNPGFIRYRLALPPGSSRVFLANCISLLPGTLCVDIVGDVLLLHALDIEADVIRETCAAERRVEKLYGISEDSVHV